jgi:galactose-6-phosphate isomerase
MGCVYPLEKQMDLYRRDSGEMISEAITIYTRFPLTSGSGAYDADIIIWNGQRYTVTMVDDFSLWGSGFTVATGTLLDVSP